MARASIVPLLSLGEFGQIMGIDPWHLNQIEHTVSGGCKDVYYQYAWQRDWLSREALAQALVQAENALTEQLGFFLAPVCVTDETVLYPRPARRTAYGGAGTARGMWKTVQLTYKKLIGPGLCVRLEVDSDKLVTYTTTNGVEDGFSLTLPAVDSAGSAMTDPNEVAVYFSAAERVGEVDEIWRIRPIQVTFSGANMTITGHKADLAKPELQMDPTVPDQPLPNVAATYATTIDVYRIYRDDRATSAAPSQGVAVWESANCPPDCLVDETELCMGVRNTEMGQVSVQLPSTWPQDREPDRLRVNYVSGIPRVNGRMNTQIAQVVAALACTFLPSEKCGCEWVDRLIAYWREIPPANPEAPGARQVFRDEVMGNPWGPSRGARRAWMYVTQHPAAFTPAMVL